ncbi:MAG: aminoglycoside phosphotransferase family protein [Anaerolineae bacterium]
MSQETNNLAPIEPPADVPEIQRGNWLSLAAGSPIVEYVTEGLWDRAEPPGAWEVARLSQAAYTYRETHTQWSVVAKFYAVKAGASAQEYAARELDCIRQIQALGSHSDAARAITPRGVWRGVLFLEYVDGLTLEDIIAVRRSQPGRLTDALETAARFLAELHVRSLRQDEEPDFEAAVRYAHGIVQDLGKHGVLQADPVAQRGLTLLIDRWAAEPAMEEFVPTLTHGDATTTNFVFPALGQVVVVDWERLYAGDPASDLGRLTAEISHSVNQHGGSVAEAEPFVQHTVNAYNEALPGSWDAQGLVSRARFYRASSTLRIARNGWVSRLDRTALVAQALALLAE